MISGDTNMSGLVILCCTSSALEDSQLNVLGKFLTQMPIYKAEKRGEIVVQKGKVEDEMANS